MESTAPHPDPARPSRPSRKLTVEDWVGAAIRLLVEDGVDALKVPRVAADLGVTKGSFYWHFKDLAGLKTAVADHFRALHQNTAEELAALQSLPPVERVSAMANVVADPRRRGVEGAMRAWAETDGLLLPSIHELDRRGHELAYRTFLELGFDDALAHARATTFILAGRGLVGDRDNVIPHRPDDIPLIVDMLTQLPAVDVRPTTPNPAPSTPAPSTPCGLDPSLPPG